MGLLATLAVAPTPSQRPPHGQPQPLTWAKDEGRGHCTAATGAAGTESIVVGEGVENGERMLCVDTGNMRQCQPGPKEAHDHTTQAVRASLVHGRRRQGSL